MAMQNSQHHNRVISDVVEHAMFENRQVHTADVGKSNRIQRGLDWKIGKTFVDLDQKSLGQTGLLPGIPAGTGLNVSFNERMKVERQHFFGRD